MISLVDTHIHIDAPELNGQGVDFLPQEEQCGISHFIVPGVRVSGWSGMLALAKNRENVYLAPGLHPAHAGQWNDETANQLRALVRQPKVVAIGEIGLDREVAVSLLKQEVVFCAQLKIALAADLPVLLHVRGATGAVLAILKDLNIGPRIGGIWHGFSESLAVAEELVALGFKLGVGPILLRNNVRKLPAAVNELPASALVLETDFPDMTETPETLLAIATQVAKLRDCSVAEVAQFTTENAAQLFHFQD